MYMAQMYCYGMDPLCAGITGIVGCIGCVYVGATNLYAVHIPPQDLARQKGGAAEFAGFVLGGPDKDTVSQGELHLFVNGMNRNEAADEAHDLRAALNKPATNVYRIMTNLGPESGKYSAAAVSILVKRLGSSIKMTYKHVPEAEYEAGGAAKRGCYDRKFEGTFGDAIKPKDCDTGWFEVNSTNCHILGIKG